VAGATLLPTSARNIELGIQAPPSMPALSCLFYISAPYRRAL
jgi:hypothetical protein